MKQTKIRVGVLFGGQSAEHEVSVRSAKAVIEHLDPEKYEVYPIGIDKKGSWHHLDYRPLLLSLQRDHLPTFRKSDPHFPLIKRAASKKGSFFSPSLLRETLDVVFPILHGPLGEDGTVQGLLELSRIPYVGPDHLSSAICMDKGVMKALLHVAGLPTARYRLLKKGEPVDEKGLCALFPFPLFVKPAQMGSSLGITKVEHENELMEAIKRAFQYDETILIEEGIEGREIECSVLGNEEVEASLPGEVIPTHAFYSYEAKYLDENGAHFELPAKLSEKKTSEVQAMAKKAYQALRCEGMARVDFFLKKDGTLLINELNTLPGFTPISLYPKLWEISGLSYTKLIDRLIELAFKRHERRCGV